MKKQLLILSAMMLVGALASCSGGENHNPGAVSDGAASSPAASLASSDSVVSVPTSDPSQPTETSHEAAEVTYPLLTVHLYQRYVDETCSAALKKQFEDHLLASKAEVTKLNWVMGTGAQNEGVADYSADIDAYDAAHEGETIDVVLGAKANFASDSYIMTNFATLKKADGSGNVTMSTTNGETTKEDRYIWVRKETANLDAVKALLKGLVDYDYPEEQTSQEQSSEPVSSEEQTSEAVSSQGQSSQEASSQEQTSEAVSSQEQTSEVVSSEEQSSEASTPAEPVVLPVLTVHLYFKFVDADNSALLKSNFETYLSEHSITITSLNWVLGSTTGNGSAYATEVSNYDAAHEDAKVDVILGVRGGVDSSYISSNFSTAKIEGTAVTMTTSSEGQGTKSDRYIFLRNDSANTAAMDAVVAAFAGK